MGEAEPATRNPARIVSGPGQTSKIVATVTHPFWITSLKTWVDAGHIKAGMLLRTSTGAAVSVTAVKIWHHQHLTHDLTVQTTHTYYVLAGTTSVLVHNCDGEPSDELLDLADAHIGKTNVAAEVVATDGTRGFGVSVARSLEELTPKVRAAVQATGHHGGCAEIGALCELESQGAPIEGARGQAVHVMGGSQDHPADLHGEDLPFCASCRNLFRYLEGGPLHE